MVCTEAYKEHIMYTFNGFCKVVICYAAINAWRERSRQRQREISFEYLTEKKFYPFSTSDEYFTDPYKEYRITICGQTIILTNGNLATALLSLPEKKREIIYLYFFGRYTQQEIGEHISSKNADYGAAEQYLTFEHDEFTMKPTLDENGRLIPRDAQDNGLTVDKAQELGERYCKEHFPGHQALVCTNPDGHNHSGNIHVHIVINSLRIEEVPLLPYMDRPADTKAGCKHRCTDAAIPGTDF